MFSRHDRTSTQRQPNVKGPNPSRINYSEMRGRCKGAGASWRHKHFKRGKPACFCSNTHDREGAAGRPCIRLCPMIQNVLHTSSSRAAFARESGANEETKTWCRAAEKLEKDLLDQPTPHGQLMKHMRIERPGLPAMECQYADPKAMLWASLQISEGLRRTILEGLAQGRPCKLVLATDDVKPGNALRPDKGRTYYALYFTLCCLPHWLRRTAHGWWSILFIPANIVDLSPSGLSEVLEFIILKLFPGWVISFTNEGQVYTVDVEWGFLTGDEKALKSACTCKGAGSYRICMKCKNILGRIEAEAVADDPYFQHFTTPSATLFEEYTFESWQEVIAYVRKAWEENPREAECIEKRFGVSFNGGKGLQWGAAAPIVRLPEGIHYDSMHCLWASGGVAQYECNQFIRRIYGLGVPAERLQTFCEQVRIPERTKIFIIKKRIRNTDKDCIRCFAAEILHLIVSLMFLFALCWTHKTPWVKNANVSACYIPCCGFTRAVKGLSPIPACWSVSMRSIKGCSWLCTPDVRNPKTISAGTRLASGLASTTLSQKTNTVIRSGWPRSSSSI